MENVKQELNQLLADLAVFYRKLQNFHWNVEGKDFFVVHAKLEEYYDQINTQIDEIAEHILILGGQPIGTLKEYLSMTKIAEAQNQKLTSDVLLPQVVKDFEYLLGKAIEIKQQADTANDYATSVLIDGYIQEYGKIIWMLKQSKY